MVTTAADMEGLFGALPIPEQRSAARAVSVVAPPVQWPNRVQMELRPVDLESLLAADHKARIVWGYVEQQDLSLRYARIKAVAGGVGRAPIAPEILLSLWLYATLQCVGSARALARLCEAHDAHPWLCGGVGVNHPTLSDFRVGCGKFLDRLLTTKVAALLSCGAVSMVRVAQDGLRVRADAGAASCRRKARRQDYLAQARDQIAVLTREIEGDPDATNRRQQAARQRAAREREQRAADRASTGAAAASRAGQEGQRAADRKCAGIDDRRRGHCDEDGRRWVSSGRQRSHGHRYPDAGDRRPRQDAARQ